MLLGHPTCTFAIVLVSMILFTGLGSFLSERITVEPAGAGRVWLLPIVIAAALSLLLLVPLYRLAPRRVELATGLGGSPAVP